MINPNEKLEITITGYLPQVDGDANRYCDTDFFVISASLKKIYLNKYARKDYKAALHLFKAEVI